MFCKDMNISVMMTAENSWYNRNGK